MSLSLWKQGARNLWPELEVRYRQLVTSGYRNGYNGKPRNAVEVEREMGLEPTTSCLEGRSSTTELLPLGEHLGGR